MHIIDQYQTCPIKINFISLSNDFMNLYFIYLLKLIMNQSKGNSTNLSRVQSQMIMMDRNRKEMKEGLMSQVTMRKSGSAIQIVQRMVSGKDNNSNGNNIMSSLKSYNNIMPTINNLSSIRNSPTILQPQQQDKMQQLKNRFKRIKSNYDQTHQTLFMGSNNLGRNLTVMESSSSFGGIRQSRKSCQDGSGNNIYGCYKEESSTNIAAYNCSDSIARQSYTTVRFGSSSSLQPLSKSPNPNDISFNCDTSQPASSYRGSDNHYQNQIDMKDKYRSLTKQLSSFEHSELISLLVGEMEDNEKNKQFVERSKVEIEKKEGEKKQMVKEIGLYREEIERLKLFIKQIQSPTSSNKQQLTTQQQQHLHTAQKQIQRQRTQIQKLRKQLQIKRQQMQILLQTEKKNLGIIQKLKRVNKMNSNSTNTSSNLEQLQMQLEEQGIINSNNSNNNNNNNNNSNDYNNNKARSYSTILNQQKCPLHPCQQKSLSMSHILPSSQDNINTNLDYKQKHDQLQQYMNEYISSVNNTYNQYQRTLSELRELNCQLKDNNKQLINQNIMLSNKVVTLTNQNSRLIPLQCELNNQLGAAMSRNQQLQVEIGIMKSDTTKLATCISNSKLVIEELQQEFSLLKNENIQLKQLLQISKEQNQRIIVQKSQSEKQMNLLTASNERLLNQNQQLIRNMTELQIKIGMNAEVEEEIRIMVEELTQNKVKQINIIQQQVGVINELRKQIEQKTNQLQNKISQLHSIKSQLSKSQLTQSQLTHKLSLTTQSNNILQQTVSEMSQLITGLISQHRQFNQRQDSLKQKLIQIMNQVKIIENAYQWECQHKESLRQMLALFWQKEGQLLPHNDKLSNACSNTYSNTSKTNSLKSNFIISRTKSQGSAIFNNHKNNYNQNDQIHQISFKKGSVITKQGSSSILLNNNKPSPISPDIKSSKVTSSIQQPIIESSAISHKYYSSQIEDNFNINADDSCGECNVLKQASSRINVNREVCDGSSSNDWKDRMIKVGGGYKRV